MPHRFDECFQNFTNKYVFVYFESFFRRWQSRDSRLVYEKEWRPRRLASSYWFLLSARSQLAHRCRCRNHLSTITPNTIVLSRSPVTQYVQQSDTQTLLPDTVTQSTSQPLCQVCIRTREGVPWRNFLLKTWKQTGTVICLCCQIHSSVFSLLRITKVSVWTPIRKFKAETSLDGQCRYWCRWEDNN